MQNISKYFGAFLCYPIILGALIMTFLGVPIDSMASYTPINLEESNYIWPTQGFTTLSSKFGKRYSPTKGASTYHQGIDILAYQGSSVKAMKDGIVKYAGWDSAGGYMVKIEHEEGLATTYCHLSKEIYVKKDENVLKGQIIGTVGPKYVSKGVLNGATTGVHLHFGVFSHGIAIDPMKLF